MATCSFVLCCVVLCSAVCGTLDVYACMSECVSEVKSVRLS